MSRGIEILRYFNSLKEEGKVLDTYVHLRSQMDVDILCVVQDDKVELAKIFIESSLYTRKDFNVEIVNRRRNKILALTKDKVTYEISVIKESEFNRQR